MANSTYHYSQYQSYKSQAIGFGKNVKTLERIKNSLTSDFYDEQEAVNRKLNELKDDLKQAVRHDAKVDTIANDCELYKEKSTTADKNLNGAVVALENEIASLNSKKTTAEQNRDTQYQNYTTAKQAESQT